MKKRCVIIGSGLGGLSCGVILARNGYDVTVLEQDARIGGCLQCFRRGDAKFETGMHFIGSCDEGQVLRRLLRYLEVFDDLRLSPPRPLGLRGDLARRRAFPAGAGARSLHRGAGGTFSRRTRPAERLFRPDRTHRPGLVAACPAVRDLGSRRPGRIPDAEHRLGARRADPRPAAARCAGGAILPLYAAEKGRTPFATHAFITDFYNRGAFRIVGGSDAVAESLARTLVRRGGRIETSRRGRADPLRCRRGSCRRDRRRTQLPGRSGDLEHPPAADTRPARQRADPPRLPQPHRRAAQHDGRIHALPPFQAGAGPLHEPQPLRIHRHKPPGGANTIPKRSGPAATSTCTCVTRSIPSMPGAVW